MDKHFPEFYLLLIKNLKIVKRAEKLTNKVKMSKVALHLQSANLSMTQVRKCGFWKIKDARPTSATNASVTSQGFKLVQK
jgi:hypothetical protein